MTPESYITQAAHSMTQKSPGEKTLLCFGNGISPLPGAVVLGTLEEHIIDSKRIQISKEGLSIGASRRALKDHGQY